MIWILWLLYILADAYFNYLREKGGEDIRHGINFLYRCIIGAVFVWRFHLLDNRLQLLFFILGAFFSFWLLFNMVLNGFNRMPINYLGKKAILDRFEAATLPWIVWAIFKTMLAASFIYYFYNTDLL